MRVEPYTIDSYVHVMKRGARGMNITSDERDKERFLKLLAYMNDSYKSEWWERETMDNELFVRPEGWPTQKPLTSVLAYCLMPNHFHLLLKEITKGGISMFIRKVADSMTMHFNCKYRQKGSIFQGPYKAKTVSEDMQLQYLAAYIMVKNTFELSPGGIGKAIQDFERAWQWAVDYPYSSLGSFINKTHSAIVSRDILDELFPSRRDFKSFARDVIEGGKWDEKDEF